MKFPRIKICCISSIEEAQLAINSGAAALGLVSEMPSGPGVISDELIAEIVRTVPPPIGTFLLTSRQDADAIIEQHFFCRTNTLQLVDHVAVSELKKLRAQLPGVSLVQVIHVNGPESIEEAKSIAPFVDAILLDSGNQKLAIKELGGTGRRHDWRVSQKIRETCGVPLFLAGGLNPENVGEAVQTVKPFGLDICSGLRTNGKLDSQKVDRFFGAIEAAC